MATVQRWIAAQHYERSFWAETSSRIARGSVTPFDWYRGRAEQLADRLCRHGLSDVTTGDATVEDSPVPGVGSPDTGRLSTGPKPFA